MCTSFLSAMQGASIAYCQCHSCLLCWQKLGHSSTTVTHATPVWWTKQVMGCERSKAFQSSGFSKMDPRQLGWNTARGWSCCWMMSVAIGFFPFLCSLKTFFSNLHKEHYLPFFIFSYLFFSFLQLTPIESKTSTKRQLY